MVSLGLMNIQPESALELPPLKHTTGILQAFIYLRFKLEIEKRGVYNNERVV